MRHHLLARAALRRLDASEMREVALRMIKNNIFGSGRLHAVDSLQMYDFSPLILLDNVVGEVHDGNLVDSIARNYSPAELTLVMKIAGKFSSNVDEVIAEMRKCEVFGNSYNPSGAAQRWTQSRVWKFVKLLSFKADVPIPAEAAPLRARFMVSDALRSYLGGYVESADFSGIVSHFCGDDDALFQEIFGAVSSESAALGKFLAIRRHIPFNRVGTASSFEPVCNGNRRLHDLAKGESKLIVVGADIKAFGDRLQETKFFAVTHQLKKAAATELTDFISFRLKDRTFHYSFGLSWALAPEFAQVLKEGSRGKTVFILGRTSPLEILERRFGWVPDPANVVDASQIATRIGAVDSVGGLSEKLTGHPFCWRASIFRDDNRPSQIAMQHCDIGVTLLYKFCVGFGHYREEEERFADERREQRHQERESRRRGNDDEGSRRHSSSSSTGSRSHGYARPRSRDRSRHRR